MYELSQDEINDYFDLDLAPRWGHKGQKMNADQLEACRIKTAHTPLPTFLGHYGNQDVFPRDYLLEKGLLAFCISEGDQPYRKLTEVEMLSMLGFPHDFKLNFSVKQCYAMLGNSWSRSQRWPALEWQQCWMQVKIGT